MYRTQLNKVNYEIQDFPGMGHFTVRHLLKENAG